MPELSDGRMTNPSSSGGDLLDYQQFTLASCGDERSGIIPLLSDHGGSVPKINLDRVFPPFLVGHAPASPPNAAASAANHPAKAIPTRLDERRADASPENLVDIEISPLAAFWRLNERIQRMLMCACEMGATLDTTLPPNSSGC